MSRLMNRLAVQLEYERWMASLQDIIIDVLMAGDAGVCAQVKIAEIAHPGVYPGVVGPIRTSVSPQPGTSGSMAAFA